MEFCEHNDAKLPILIMVIILHPILFCKFHLLLTPTSEVVIKILWRKWNIWGWTSNPVEIGMRLAYISYYKFIAISCNIVLSSKQATITILVGSCIRCCIRGFIDLVTVNLWYSWTLTLVARWHKHLSWLIKPKVCKEWYPDLTSCTKRFNLFSCF